MDDPSTVWQKHHMETEGKNSLGRKLAEIRKSKRLSAPKAAEAIGISYPSLWRYERGEREPKLGDLRRILAFYGLTVEEFEAGDVTRPPPLPLGIEDRKIGARLEQIRLVFEPDLPRLIGINSAQWSLYVEGREEVPASVVRDASEHTGVPYGYIFSGDISGMSPDVVSRLIDASLPKLD